MSVWEPKSNVSSNYINHDWTQRMVYSKTWAPMMANKFLFDKINPETHPCLIFSNVALGSANVSQHLPTLMFASSDQCNHIVSSCSRVQQWCWCYSKANSVWMQLTHAIPANAEWSSYTVITSSATNKSKEIWWYSSMISISYTSQCCSSTMRSICLVFNWMP